MSPLTIPSRSGRRPLAVVAAAVIGATLATIGIFGLRSPSASAESIQSCRAAGPSVVSQYLDASSRLYYQTGAVTNECQITDGITGTILQVQILSDSQVSDGAIDSAYVTGVNSVDNELAVGFTNAAVCVQNGAAASHSISIPVYVFGAQVLRAFVCNEPLSGADVTLVDGTTGFFTQGGQTLYTLVRINGSLTFIKLAVLNTTANDYEGYATGRTVGGIITDIATGRLAG